ncbi:MAG: GAF domain-containing protein [Vicingaceae bacterium]
MISPLIQQDDDDRVENLKLYQIHGTAAEKDYDHVAGLASSICECPVSLVSFIDAKRQWFKASVGTELKENTRELALCSHTINDVRNTTYIPDTTKDIRFKHHPIVDGPANVKFYAGVPIVSPEGYALGTVCVMDHKSKRLNRQQLKALVHLRDFVQELLAIRRAKLEK